MKILFSNIGYAKGIDGTLWQHFCRLSRHFYCGQQTQEQVLAQLKTIIKEENPDLCCFVEVDQGSMYSANFDQLNALKDGDYRFHDVADKYGDNSRLGRMPLHMGKSNGFMSKNEYAFERLYFRHGSKRLIYKIQIPRNITVFFSHFSLQKNIRVKQLNEIREMVASCSGEVIILADFNIMMGFSELGPLLDGTDLQVLNDEDEPTFTFHRRRLALDLCICSQSLFDRAELQIIPQPFSDHDALLLHIEQETP